MFITLEGIDGTGKTTVAPLIKAALEKEGYPVDLYRTPGGLPSIGTQLRDMVLSPEYHIPARARMFMFLAEMLALDEDVIRPAEEAGRITLFDRYVDSTMVFQVFAGTNWDDDEKLAMLVLANHLLLAPDVTFILDIPVEVAMERNDTGEYQGKGDNFDQAKAHVWQRRRDAYLDLPRHAENALRKYVIINAQQPVEDVAHTILNVIKAFLILKEKGEVCEPVAAAA